MRYKFTRDFYIPKGSVKVADKLSDAVAYLHTNKLGMPCAMFFCGKRDKPDEHTRYRDEARRVAAIGIYFQHRREALAHKSSRQEQRKTANKAAAANVQVGDIYRTCWGYDQTNVEFFEVVEINGRFAILREVAQASESNGHGQDKCVPQSGAYLEPRFEGDDRGKPIRRLIQDGHIKICDVRSAWPWGKRDPITGTVIGKAAYSTSAGWGH